MNYDSMGIPLTIDLVSTTRVVPNPWNTNTMSPANEQKLRNSIDKFGMYKPILVRTLDNGMFEILGGEHRWKIAMEDGTEQIQIINLGKIDDERAKQISLTDNARYGADDPLELSKLLGEIDDITSFLPFSDADLESMRSVTSIDLDSLLLPEETATTSKVEEPADNPQPQFQIMRFKVGIEYAWKVKAVIEAIIKEHGFNDQDPLVNAGDALVELINENKKL